MRRQTFAGKLKDRENTTTSAGVFTMGLLKLDISVEILEPFLEKIPSETAGIYFHCCASGILSPEGGGGKGEGIGGWEGLLARGQRGGTGG